MKQVSIIGVGLIGGSFALDLKHFIPEVHITGIDQNETQKELDTIIGSEVNVWANASIAKAYEKDKERQYG